MLINLSHLGLLQVSGPDAKKLLQGQLTCNLEEISETQSRLGAHCNPQGRIHAVFHLFWWQGVYYLQMPSQVLPQARAALQKYAMFFKVALQDASDKLLRLAGSQEDLQGLFPTLPATDYAVLPQENCLIIRLSGAPSHYEIIGAPQALASLAAGALTSEAAQNTWKRHHIEAGIPHIYATTTGKLLPHEVNLPRIHGVSFNKGCYTGQEIIARMHYRGQIKKQMYRARVNTPHLPLAGHDIHTDKPAGIIIDSCRENASSCQLLVLANQSDVQSNKLFLDPDKREPLEFIPLPY